MINSEQTNVTGIRNISEGLARFLLELKETNEQEFTDFLRMYNVKAETLRNIPATSLQENLEFDRTFFKPIKEEYLKGLNEGSSFLPETFTNGLVGLVTNLDPVDATNCIVCGVGLYSSGASAIGLNNTKNRFARQLYAASIGLGALAAISGAGHVYFQSPNITPFGVGSAWMSRYLALKAEEAHQLAVLVDNGKVAFIDATLVNRLFTPVSKQVLKRSLKKKVFKIVKYVTKTGEVLVMLFITYTVIKKTVAQTKKIYLRARNITKEYISYRNKKKAEIVCGKGRKRSFFLTSRLRKVKEKLREKYSKVRNKN